MLFESLDRHEQELAAKRSGARAIIAANQKIEKSIRPYLTVASGSPTEYEARLQYVSGAIMEFVRDACSEYEADIEIVRTAVMDNLKLKEANTAWDMPMQQEQPGEVVPMQPSTFEGPACPKCRGKWGPDGQCMMCGFNIRDSFPDQNGALRDRIEYGPHQAGTKWSGPHKDDCSCGFCQSAFGREPEEEENITAEARTAADVPTGDTYEHERVSLPKAGPSGLADVGSPKIDKGRVPKDGLKPVDVPSKANPSEMQDIEQQADLDTQTNQGANGTPDPTLHPHERVNADSPMQPAETHGPGSQTFPKGNMADPVTSKWTVEGGQPETNV
jgi:hypothetical protein